MAKTSFKGPVASANGFITGTSSSPVSVTSASNVSSMFVSASNTTGDVRANYSKLTFTSTGSGETGRWFTVISGANGATGGTINGGHISLSITGSGTVSGAANALRATLGIGANVSPGGTIAAIQLDSDISGTGTTIPATAAFLRVSNSGGKTLDNFLNVPAPASGKIFQAQSAANGNCTHVLKIVAANGTPYYLMASDKV